MKRKAPDLTDAIRQCAGENHGRLCAWQQYASGVVIAEFYNGSMLGRVTVDGVYLTMGRNVVRIEYPQTPADRGASGLDNEEQRA